MDKNQQNNGAGSTPAQAPQTSAVPPPPAGGLAPAPAPTATPTPAAAPATGTRYGGFWIRLVAMLIDVIVISIVATPFSLLLGTTDSRIDPVRSIISLVYWVVLTWKFKATLGKMALKMEVRKDDGSELTVMDVVMREIVGKLVSGIILGIGYIMAGFDAKKQGLHDKIAKTVVVYK